MTFNLFCVYLGYFFVILNTVLYTISFFQKKKVNGFFMAYLYFALTMNAIMEVYYALHRNNLFFMNMFFIGDMILLGLFFASIIKDERHKLGIKLSILFILILLCFQIANDVDQLFSYNLFEITVTCLAVLAFAILHLYKMLMQQKRYYYFTIGLILYLSSSTILYLVGDLTIKLPNSIKLVTWTLNAILIVVYQLFIMYEWKMSFYEVNCSKSEFNIK